MDFCGPYDKQLAEQYRPPLRTPLLAGWEFWQKPTLPTESTDWQTIAKAQDWLLTKAVREDLRNNAWAVVITDAEQVIQYVNTQFEHMTGYTRTDVVGLRPNFLQGEETSEATRWRMKQAIAQYKAINDCVLNYRKDHSTYWCRIKILPIRNRQKQVVNFVAFEVEVPAENGC